MKSVSTVEEASSCILRIFPRAVHQQGISMVVWDKNEDDNDGGGGCCCEWGWGCRLTMTINLHKTLFVFVIVDYEDR
jgi:hypothetical protein